MKTAIVDKSFLGGTCLNIGCIPSKALLDSTHKLHRNQHSFADHGITVGDVKVDLAEDARPQGRRREKDDQRRRRS